MKIFNVRGSHYSTPGERTTLHLSIETAAAAALLLINMIRADLDVTLVEEGYQGLPEATDPTKYREALREAQAMLIAYNDGTLDAGDTPAAAAKYYSAYDDEDMARDSKCDVSIWETGIAEGEVLPTAALASVAADLLAECKAWRAGLNHRTNMSKSKVGASYADHVRAAAAIKAATA